MPKIVENGIKFEVVSDDLRRNDTSWASSDLMKALVDGKTVRIEDFGRNNSLYKAARTAGYRLRSRTDGTATVLWLIPDTNNNDILRELTPEAETVNA